MAVVMMVEKNTERKVERMAEWMAATEEEQGHSTVLVEGRESAGPLQGEAGGGAVVQREAVMQFRSFVHV